MSGIPMTVENLRVDLLTEPRGLGNPQPTFTWELSDPSESAWHQAAWRIVVAATAEDAAEGRGTVWDSGRVENADTAFVRYGGIPLESRAECYWRVSVWGTGGDELTSEVASWTMGLLDGSDWSGKWIGLDASPETPPDPFVGARWIWTQADPEPGNVSFEKGFTLDAPIAGQLWGLADDEGDVEINGQPLCQLARAQSGTDSYPIPVVVPVPAEMLRVGENLIRVTAKKRHSRDPHAGLIVRLALGGQQVVDFGRGQEVALFAGNQRHFESALDIVTDGSWRQVDADGKRAVRELGSYGVEPWHQVTVREYPNLSARYLRREFAARGRAARAVLYLSGLGVSEAWINGELVGDEVLSPHATDPNERFYYRTHDVTELVREGGNAIGCILGNGRYFAPRRRLPFPMETYGCPKLLLQLEITYADGSTERVVSDSAWRLTADGAVGWNNEFDGEHYDARRDDPAWSQGGFDDADWVRPQLVAAPMGRMVAQRSAPIRRGDIVLPVESWQTKYGTTIFDFGENLVGWCQVTLRGEEGNLVILRHSEGLESRDALAVENLRSAQATDFVTLGGAEARFEPKFVYHGFRYVELRGNAEVVEIAAVYVHDEISAVGSFVCSSEVVNRIVDAAARGIRTNCRSMPTDCPQRDERMGWLGDRAGGAPGEMYLFELKNFYEKWMEDIRDAQAVNGCIPDLAPPFWQMYNDNVTWPSVVAFLPHWLHRHYGDIEVIRENFAAIGRWIEHMSSYLEAGLIDRDLYGDWCVPPEEPHLILTNQPERKTSGTILASTYLAKDLELAAAFARQMDRGDLADRWMSRRAEIAAALNEEFFDPVIGCYDNGSQTAALLPLAFGITPEDSAEQVFDYLVSRITETGEPVLGTGLVGGQSLLRTLARHGRVDLARALATREDYPSWGHMIRNGATTIWELWNGDTASPFMNSGNHVMLLGDLIPWLFEDVAGIQAAEPGFRRVRLQPNFVFDSVNCSHRSIRGTIESRWETIGSRIEWSVLLPPNVDGWAEIPAQMADSVELDGARPEIEERGHRRVGIRLNPGRHVFALEKRTGTSRGSTRAHDLVVASAR